MDKRATYEDVSREQALNIKDHVTHASHTLLYAPVNGKLFGKYNINYTVMVCVCVCVCACAWARVCV